MKPIRIILITLMLITLAAASLPPQQSTSAGSDTFSVFDIVWSPDGRWMAVPSYQGAWFFDLKDPDADPIHLFPDRYATTIAFDPTANSRAAIASEASEFENRDLSIVMVDLETPDTPEVIFEGPDSFPVVYDIGFTRDGRYLYHTNENVIEVYDLETGHHTTIGTRQTDYGSSDWITSVTETDTEGVFMASDWSSRLTLYDLNSSNFEYRTNVFYLDPLYIFKIEFVGDNTYLVHDTDGIYSFNTDTEDLTLLDLPIAEHVSGFELSPDQRLLAVGSLHQWALYDRVAETVLLDMQDIEINSDWNPVVFAFAFNPDATQIATLAVDGAITIYDIETGEVIMTLGNFDHAVSYKWG